MAAEKKEKENYFPEDIKKEKENYFTEDIIFELFSRLPINTLLRFRCVCKYWFGLIDHPYFVKMHLTRSIQSSSNLSMVSARYKDRGMDGVSIISVDLDLDLDLDVDDCKQQEAEADQRIEVEVGYPFPTPVESYLLISCNGLVYMFDTDLPFKVDSPTFLLNPSTRRHKKLPYMRLSRNTHLSYDVAYGFGYDPTTEDYKVIRVLGFHDDSRNYNIGFEVQVYSLTTNSWRRIDDEAGNNNIPSFHVHHRVGVLKNSAFHWLSRSKTNEDHIGAIVSLDIKEDKYREMPLPDHLHLPSELYGLTNLNGCLVVEIGVIGQKNDICLICVSFKKLELWVMKDYGVKDSWEKLVLIEQFRVPSRCFFKYVRPICFSKNGDLILEANIVGSGFVVALLLYDPRKGTLSELKVTKPRKLGCCGPGPGPVGRPGPVCIGSLVSLN